MWPLATCSLIALAIIVERMINLRSSSVLAPATVERIMALAEGGHADRALKACRDNPGIFTNVVGAGLEIAAHQEDFAHAKEAVEDAGRHESKRLHRYLGALGTIVGISPLLGLLGTVTGMIEVFETIARTSGGGGQAAALANGISQALITTATGLVIAIPSLVAYNYFNGRADAIVTGLERESLRALRCFYHPSQITVTEVTRPDLSAASAGE